MSGVIKNKNRIGRFTSSEIWRLTTKNKAGDDFGSPGISYIKEKNLERKLGRSLSLNKGGQSASWGNFLEQYVHNLLPTSYELKSKETLDHFEYPDIWSGSPDNLDMTNKIVADTKCYEPQNFAEYNDVLIKAKETGDLSEWKKDYAKEYWQLVSNACIMGFDIIEAITFMPYESELERIKEMAVNYDGEDSHKYNFIVYSKKHELPYLPNSCKTYKNLNIYRFEVSKSDKYFLTDCVKRAGKLLINQS